MRNLVLVLIMTMVMATSALAYAPSALTFQGRLADSGGSALPDGNYSVTFRLYSQQNGGAPLWSSTRQVNLSGGVFSVVLGQNTPLSLPFDQLYFVGVQYEAEPEMTPRVVLTATPYALGVSEDAAVTSLNGLTGDFNLVGGSNVNVSQAGDNLVISSNGAVSDNDWNVVGNDMNSAPSGNVGVGTTQADSKLHVVGDITTGDSNTLGTFRTYNSGGALSEFGGDHNGQGGKIELYQEDNTRFMFLEPDVDGEGGFFQVYNSLGGAAIQVDGNNSGDTRVSFNGTASVVFDLEADGDPSVILPTSAISALETLDEAGIASRNDHGNSASAVGTSYGPITSRTITVPADGFILASSSLEIELNHQGSSCYVTAGLSTSSTTLGNNQDLSFYLPSGAAQGLYLMPSTPTAVFPVTAGSHTIYLVASRSGTSDAVIWDAQLNLLFVPTSYGSVTLADGVDDGRQTDNNQVSAAVSSSDLARERSESVQENDRRLADELSAIRAQLDALQSEINNQQINGGEQPVR